MTDREWFRRRTWTEEDRCDFRARLRRSRNAVNKAQYLRIQAHYLEHKVDPPEIAAALELLDELLRDYPDSSELGETYRQRASCLARLGRLEEALQALRQALDIERLRPGIQGTAYLDYAELVVRLRRSDLYEDALVHLAQRVNDEPFPMLQYRSGVATALLCERQGKSSAARDAARRALTAAAKTQSPFR